MTDTQTVHFYKPSSDGTAAFEKPPGSPNEARLEPSTCVEAEPFALQVLDSSMQPEFRKGCIILIDPTGRATDGSYVLAQIGYEKATALAPDDPETAALNDVLFRQLVKIEPDGWALKALNDSDQGELLACHLSDVIGVVVQRAGVRRRYHKRYD